ncbi:MAG TPA: hypothetical protein VGG64_28450 [Pirellulales bacterium]|jgi:hypothetical protein
MRLVLSGVLLVAILVAGCKKSPAKVFDLKHGGKTVTPHGTIIEGSAQNVDGRVQYKTENGGNWTASVGSDGSFDDVRPVK